MRTKTEPRPQIYKRRLSPNQFALLRDMYQGHLQLGVRSVRVVNNGTIRSVSVRGMVDASGLTPEGREAVKTYLHMPRPERSEAKDMTEYVAIMLGIKKARSRGASA